MVKYRENCFKGVLLYKFDSVYIWSFVNEFEYIILEFGIWILLN